MPAVQIKEWATFGGKHGIAILIIFQIVLGSVYLSSVPRIYLDEAWDASLGYEFAQTGVLRHPFVRNVGGMEIYYLPPRIILPVICAGVFKVAGYSIAISRLPALLFGVLAVVFLYHIARQFFGDRQSFFICLFTIINPWFWSNCRRCRPEMCYTTLALLFLWVLISYFRRDRVLSALLAGIIAGLAFLTHPNSLIIIVAIGIGWIMWKEKPHLFKFAMWALSGFILMILPYVIYVLWASSQPGVSFLKQMLVNLLYSSVIIKEIVRWRSFFPPPFGIPMASIMFVSWLAAWWKSTAQDKFTATVAAVYPLGLILFSVNNLADYLVPAIPFFSILIVRFVCRLREFNLLSGSKKACYIAKLFVILIYATSSLPLVIFMLYQQHGDADFNRVVDEVAKVVGPKARVHAIPVFWVGHHRYIYGPYLMTYEGAISSKEALQWAYLQSFDYSIRTAWDGGKPPGDFKKLPDKMPEFRSYFLTDNLCRMFGTKVHEFYNEYYGPIEIYKINWPANPALWGLKKQTVK